MTMLNEALNQIRQEAGSIEPNTTSRASPCPWCHGGDSRERAFAVTRLPDAILYKCHRATCGKSGALPIGNLAAIPKAKSKESARFTYELIPIGALIDGDMLKDKYGLTAKELNLNNIQYCEDLNRVVYPLLDARGYTWGYCARAKYATQKPKTLNFFERDVPRLHYPNRQKGEYDHYGVCVVEDQVSSIKVARHMPCVSILGTHMGDAEATHLAKKFDGIIIFLDPGAESAAFRMARRYALLFNTVRVITGTGKDPKDMTDLQLKEVLQL